MTITAEPGRDSLATAISLAPALVTPGDGFLSFDVQFRGYQDEQGHASAWPTCWHHYSYTFWASPRRGRYQLAKIPAPPVYGGACILEAF
jgi:hypothetical protein